VALALLKRFLGRRPLPTGMDGAEIMARYGDADAIWTQWSSQLQEAYKYAIPHRDTFYTETQGQKKNTDVFDATAVLGVPAFATRMQGLLVPPWREFSQLELGPDIPKHQRESSKLRGMLAEQNDVFFSYINHSNMASQAHESFQDLAVGTGCYDLNPGQLGGRALLFNAIPLPELRLEEGPDSTIETTYRNMRVAGRNIMRRWPGAELPAKLEKLIRESPGLKHDFIEAVIFDPERGLYEGACVWKSEKEVIWRANWRTNPRICFRWSVTPGELYGRGPILQVLPDIKTANKVVEFILRNAAIQVAGMWTATTDSALNPYNFRPAPGSVIPVQSNSRDNPTLRALERSGDLNLGFEVLTQLQANIKTALFQNQREPSDAVVSATQYAIEDRELVNSVGSSFGRLQTEVVEATMVRGLDVLERRGAMPEIRVDGRQVTLKHMSPLARAQDMDDLLTLQRTLEVTPEAAVAIGIKIEDLGTWVAGKTGLDPRLIRDQAEKEVLQKKAAELIAAAQQERKAA
jgi:hypothetical protein